MPDLSVIIPARNEEFLQTTIDDVLSSMRGDTEIIVILDGYWPDPGITDHPKVTLIHHEQPIGQRAAVNEGANVSQAKYIMKLDAHCSVDNGFDVKLMERCKPDWTVIPRMYNLHAFDWVCSGCGNPIYQGPQPVSCEKCGGSDFVKQMIWRPRLRRRTDFAMFDKDLHFQYWRDYESRPQAKGLICDVMCSVGAAFFMERKRFLDLGGLDEKHGSWGQVGVEMACKAWLSGGRQVVNKKTWFAHMFRTQPGGFGFPYKISGSDQARARAYSRDLWLNNKWPLQKCGMEYILAKFGPVPTWHDDKPDEEKNKMPLLSVLIPARNEKYLNATIADIKKNFTTDFEIIVGLDGCDPEEPIEGDDRVVVFRSPDRIGMRPMINVLAGMARGKYIMKTDAHCAFDHGYDSKLIDICGAGHTVLGIRYELDVEAWQRRERTNCDFRYLSNPELDEKGGLRGLAWHEYKKQTKGEKVAESMSLSGSGWLMEKAQFDWWGGLDENHGTFAQEGVEIACKTWLSGGRLLINRDTWYAHWNRGKSPYSLGPNQRQKSIDYSIELWLQDKWPMQKYSFDWLIEKFNPPDWPLPRPRPLPAKKQGTILKGIRKVSIEQLWDHRIGIAEPAKRWRLKIFYDAFMEFLDTREVSEQSRYFKYLIGHRYKDVRYTYDDRDRDRTLKKMQRSLDLCDDIKKNGLLAPLEFYQTDGNLTLFRGYRRLCILKHLGIKNAGARVHKSETTAKQFAEPYRVERNSITELGSRQFATLGGDATDKYYVHNYLPIYDRIFGHLRRQKINILEIGLLYGASLRLWHEAFPKARIFGLDKNVTGWKKYTDGLDRIKVIVGMQQDPAKLSEVSNCGPFDIVIDDCGHVPDNQLFTFERLWPSLNPKGFYVIEDCYHSYKPGHDGPNVPMTLAARVPEIYNGYGVSSIQFFYNICIIQKGI